MFRKTGSASEEASTPKSPNMPPPQVIATHKDALRLRDILIDLTFEDVEAIRYFDQHAFKSADMTPSESVAQAALVALYHARTSVQLRHPGPMDHECLPPLEQALQPLGCDAILYEQWPDLESEALEIFEMMERLNRDLRKRDVILIVLNDGHDDHQFLAARLSAVNRHCDPEGHIPGSDIQLVRPEIYW